MANICTTWYAARSEDPAALKEMKAFLEGIKDRPSPEPSVTDWGWLGKLADALGIDWERIDCKGRLDVEDVRLRPDGVLNFETETAWSPCFELMWKFKERFPDVSVRFYSEEPGCGYFVTDDCEGRDFPERWVLLDLDGARLDGSSQQEFVDFEDAAKALEDVFGAEVKRFDGLYTGGDGWWLGRISLVDAMGVDCGDDNLS